jgi:hypothetical protein
MTNTALPESDQPQPEPGSILMFALAAVIATAALALVAAHAPARIRLLGLFSLAFGLLNTLIQTRLAAILHVRITGTVIALIAATTLAGLVGSTCQTVALQPTIKPLDNNFHPVAALVAARMVEAAPKEEIPEFGDRLHTYLIRRVSLIGNWSSPWPEVFWGSELLLGTAGAVCLAYWIRQPKAAA